MQVRATHLEDASAISRLLEDVFTATYGHALDQPSLEHHLTKHLSSEAIRKDMTAASYFLVEDERKAVGVLKLVAEAAKAEIAKLYVSKAAAGQGVGSSLIETALAWAKEKGCHTLYLNVWKENAAAIRFYQKHGFEKVGKTNVYVAEVVFDDYVLEKIL